MSFNFPSSSLCQFSQQVYDQKKPKPHLCWLKSVPVIYILDFCEKWRTWRNNYIHTPSNSSTHFFPEYFQYCIVKNAVLSENGLSTIACTHTPSLFYFQVFSSFFLPCLLPSSFFQIFSLPMCISNTLISVQSHNSPTVSKYRVLKKVRGCQWMWDYDSPGKQIYSATLYEHLGRL